MDRRLGQATTLLLAGLLSACGAEKISAAHSSPSPSATIPPSPTATVAPLPRPSGPAQLACRLPVVTGSEAGWVTFPAATYQPDPAGNVKSPAASAFGPLSRSYDKAFERWLPVPRDWISPDGQRYAYPELSFDAASPDAVRPGGIHVVDIATGKNRFFSPGTPPAGSFWWVMDYETEGVYIAAQPYGPAIPTGLWLLDPAAGHVRVIDTQRPWEYVFGGGAWGLTDPLTGHGPGGGSRLLRLDLRTGAVVSWYKSTKTEFGILGADAAGHPILSPGPEPTLMIVTRPGTTVSMRPADSSSGPDSVAGPTVADAHGIWFGSGDGSIWLYQSDLGLKRVAQIGNEPIGPAGGCH